MKNFYDSMDIRQNGQLAVTSSSGILFINGIQTDLAPLLLPFIITVKDAASDVVVYVDGNEIYPKLKHASQQTSELCINIDRAFYSWYHIQTGRGWILYDHTTY